MKGMDPTRTPSLTQATHEALVWLAHLLLEMAGERTLQAVLHKAVEAAVAVPGVVLARISLLGPGDICLVCPQRPVCPDQTQCLHAEVSKERLLHTPAQEWSKVEENYRRVPLGVFPVSQ